MIAPRFKTIVRCAVLAAVLTVTGTVSVLHDAAAQPTGPGDITNPTNPQPTPWGPGDITLPDDDPEPTPWGPGDKDGPNNDEDPDPNPNPTGPGDITNPEDGDDPTPPGPDDFTNPEADGEDNPTDPGNPTGDDAGNGIEALPKTGAGQAEHGAPLTYLFMAGGVLLLFASRMTRFLSKTR